MKSMGPATMVIDFAFETKLLAALEWDRRFGMRESDLFSAVRSLRFFYAIRRPGFVTLDLMCGCWWTT